MEMQKSILAFREKHPDAKIVLEESKEEGIYSVAIGELVSLKLGKDHFGGPDQVLAYALTLAGISTEADSNSDGEDTQGGHEEDGKGPTPDIQSDTAGQGKSGDPPAKKRGRPKQVITDGNEAAAGSPVADAGEENLGELGKAKTTICRRTEGAYLSHQQEELIEGKKIGDLQRGFIRLIAVSGNKGPSPWSPETVAAAKTIMLQG